MYAEVRGKTWRNESNPENRVVGVSTRFSWHFQSGTMSSGKANPQASWQRWRLSLAPCQDAAASKVLCGGKQGFRLL